MEGRASPFEYFGGSAGSKEASPSTAGYTKQTTLSELRPDDPEAGIVSLDDLPLDAESTSDQP
jgi:hypothetical protein